MRTALLLFFLVILIIGLTNIATLVNRNNGIPDVFQILFPEKFVDNEDVQAMETGQAPFAEAENAAQPVQLHPDIEYAPLGDSIVISERLDMPHRNEGAVSAWVTEAVGKIMTFGIRDYQEHLEVIDRLMSAVAVQEYQDFMQKSNVLALMQNRDLELKTFTTDVPRLATTGVVQGRYRWVYDIPVNMTFLPVGATSYETLSPDQFLSETLTIRIQIGRVAEGGDDGIEIETWEALKKRAE